MTAHATALVWHGPEKAFERATFPLPEPTEPGSVLVKVRMATLCGSDLHTITGHRSTPTPTVLGHEIVGDVVATGGDVRSLDGACVRPGQRVTWTLHAACGTCRRCTRGMSNKCERLRKYGHAAITPAWAFNGGLAEYCQLVPGTGVVAVPPDLSDRLVAPANCATATVVAAFRRARLDAADVVVVQGCGMLGLTAIAYARHRGVDTVVGCDPDPDRRAAAVATGATATAGPADLAGVVRTETDAQGADVVLEVSGQPSAVEASLGLLGVGGRLALVGSVSPGPDVPVNPEHVVRNLLTVVGSHNYLADDLVAAVGFLAETPYRAALERLVPEVYPLADLDRAVAAARRPSPPPRVAVVP